MTDLDLIPSGVEQAEALRGRESVAVLLGRDRELLATALAGVCPVHRVDDMAAAVRAAAAIARPNLRRLVGMRGSDDAAWLRRARQHL